MLTCKRLHDEEENELCPTISVEVASTETLYGGKNANIRQIHEYFCSRHFDSNMSRMT